MFIKTSNPPQVTDHAPSEAWVKRYHYKFINAGVSAPIVPNSNKGQKLATIKARPCSCGSLPRISLCGPPGEYLPVCENKHCRCPGRDKITSQPSHELALLEWNKYRHIRSGNDLFHPTIKVNRLPLRDIKLNLAVEQMYIDKFLAKFTRSQLEADDRKIFVLREKWLEVVKYQLSLLEARRG